MAAFTARAEMGRAADRGPAPQAVGRLQYDTVHAYQSSYPSQIHGQLLGFLPREEVQRLRSTGRDEKDTHGAYRHS